MATTYLRVDQLRRWTLLNPGLRALLERSWQLLEQRPARRSHARRSRGPIALARAEIESLGWSWEAPWALRDHDGTCLGLDGGPTGWFRHRRRHGIRQRELRQAAERRPDLEGADQVDRRAVLYSLKRRRGRDAPTPYELGAMRGVACGSTRTQGHLFAAGSVDSPTCPWCEMEVPETAGHLFFECPAWRVQRGDHLRADAWDWRELPPITQTCGLLTIPAEERPPAHLLPPLEDLPMGGPTEFAGEEWWLPASHTQREEQISYTEPSLPPQPPDGQLWSVVGRGTPVAGGATPGGPVAKCAAGGAHGDRARNVPG